MIWVCDTEAQLIAVVRRNTEPYIDTDEYRNDSLDVASAVLVWRYFRVYQAASCESSPSLKGLESSDITGKIRARKFAESGVVKCSVEEGCFNGTQLEKRGAREP